jgi:tRNA pseudouridine55 synthase
MNGILIIDKPAGITSHDVVARVRRILNTKRVGHTGTLDPFATGVMVILVGQATRLAQFLDKDEKEYEAVVRLGFETNTGDVTGERRGVETERGGVAVTPAKIEQILASFRGKIEQTPPMFSAKKVDGKKLYEHARKGETIERKAVVVTIEQLDLIDDSLTEDLDLGTWSLKLRVVCSAGTYIRTLAEDIGRKLGTGAHLAELRRTRAGKFMIQQALTLDQLELEDKNSAVIPMEHAVSHLPKFTLTEDRIEKTRSGLATRALEGNLQSGEAVRMVDASDNLLAIGLYDESENAIRPKVVLV